MKGKIGGAAALLVIVCQLFASPTVVTDDITIAGAKAQWNGAFRPGYVYCYNWEGSWHWQDQSWQFSRDTWYRAEDLGEPFKSWVGNAMMTVIDPGTWNGYNIFLENGYALSTWLALVHVDGNNYTGVEWIATQQNPNTPLGNYGDIFFAGAFNPYNNAAFGSVPGINVTQFSVGQFDPFIDFASIGVVWVPIDPNQRTTITFVPIPEPASLLGLGFGCLALYLRRRKTA